MHNFNLIELNLNFVRKDENVTRTVSIVVVVILSHDMVTESVSFFRNLLSKDFVRLGKWFVQPFEGPEKTLQKASHLSFSFQYFVHGESFICASVDVRQHPAVRRLGPQHLANARGGQSNPLQVILAPFGLAASLTGVTYKSSEAAKLLQDWNRFYPLDRTRYTCQDSFGDIVTMAPAVEVVVAGVKMVYPTSYVLVTDLDSFSGGGPSLNKKSMMLEKLEVMNNIEPSPFTTSNHPLLSDQDLLGLISQTEQAWQDGLTVNPESTLSSNEQQNSNTNDLVAAWDLGNPGRFVKKKPRSKLREKSSKDHRIRFNSKVPFHKKADTVDELAWALDHSDMLGANNNNISNNNSNGGQNNNNTKPNSNQIKAQPSLVSPAEPRSVGGGGPVTPMAITPKGGPGSVRTPGGAELLSPHPPPSNGPLTPMMEPSTPSYPIPSPFNGGSEKKAPPVVKSEILQSVLQQPPQVSSSASTAYEKVKSEPLGKNLLLY